MTNCWQINVQKFKNDEVVLIESILRSFLFESTLLWLATAAAAAAMHVLDVWFWIKF